jgi:hypothetical protein
VRIPMQVLFIVLTWWAGYHHGGTRPEEKPPDL